MTYYRESDGAHVCDCGELTRYRLLSGGREWYCEHCGADGIYPEGEGGPLARLLDQGPDGIALLRAKMDQEMARRKDIEEE